MKVKATQKGFDGTTLREPGDVFEMPDTTVVPVTDDKGNPVVKNGKAVTKEVPTTGRWFEPVSKKEAKAQDADGQGASNLV